VAPGHEAAQLTLAQTVENSILRSEKQWALTKTASLEPFLGPGPNVQFQSTVGFPTVTPDVEPERSLA
jgi:hypothetical protein